MVDNSELTESGYESEAEAELTEKLDRTFGILNSLIDLLQAKGSISRREFLIALKNYNTYTDATSVSARVQALVEILPRS